jgi:hypothetical protein
LWLLLVANAAANSGAVSFDGIAVFGSGTGTLVSETSRVPSLRTVDRSWNPVA